MKNQLDIHHEQFMAYAKGTKLRLQRRAATGTYIWPETAKAFKAWIARARLMPEIPVAPMGYLEDGVVGMTTVARPDVAQEPVYSATQVAEIVRIALLMAEAVEKKVIR